MNYPKEQIQFLQSVLEMREAQKDYFSQPSNYRLTIAKQREQKLDALLQPYIKAGVIKSTEKHTISQTTLFNS